MQHTIEALQRLFPLFGPDTFVVSFQNGFNEPGIADADRRRSRGARAVIGSIPNYGAHWSIPGTLP